MLRESAEQRNFLGHKPSHFCLSIIFQKKLLASSKVMTVTFVPPRTFIRGAGPTTIVGANAPYTAEAEDRDEDEDLDEDIEMGGMDEHGRGSLLTKKLVVPGQLVTDDPQFMRYGCLLF